MGALCQRSPLSSRASSRQPLGTKGPVPLLGHSFSRTWDRSTRCLWNEADLLSLMDIQRALFSLTRGRVLFCFVWNPPLTPWWGCEGIRGLVVMELGKRRHCNISLKINAPQSSGRKPSLIAAAPFWHGHSNPREALESYQTWWETTPIVPARENSGANCKLKHHQRGILIEGSLTSGHLQIHAEFHHSEKFPLL